MRKKEPIPFSHKFPNADPLALDLLQRLLAFDPKDRPTAEEVTGLLVFYSPIYLDSSIFYFCHA
jgi:serine/threonine protein kinase